MKKTIMVNIKILWGIDEDISMLVMSQIFYLISCAKKNAS
jgi:hypothetical protein